MAHFIGKVVGSRGSATRLGTKRTGLMAEANGWELGARIEMQHDPDTGEDTATVYLTGGSHPAYGSKFLGTYRVTDLAEVR
jgi:hypothetical protein